MPRFASMAEGRHFVISKCAANGVDLFNIKGTKKEVRKILNNISANLDLEPSESDIMFHLVGLNRGESLWSLDLEQE